MKAVLPGPMPSHGRSWIMRRAAIQTLILKLLELSSRPATRLITRTRSGSTWLTSSTSATLPPSSSSSGSSRRHRGGQLRVWRSASSSTSPPSAATMPIQAPRL